MKIVGVAALIVTVSASSGSASEKSSGSLAPYHIGLVTSLTGPEASVLIPSLKGAQACIDLQNAQGGVNGHKLVLDSADDAGSATQALTAAQDLVENKNDLIVATTSYFTSGMSSYLHSVGEPVVGANWDGPEWSTKPNTNMFGTWGPFSPDFPPATTYPNLFKQLHASKLACVGDDIPAGHAYCASEAAAAASIGLKTVYTNTSLAVTESDFTSVALGIKNLGATGILLGMGPTQDIPMAVALEQAGVHVPAELLSAGYDSDTLNNPTDVQSARGDLCVLLHASRAPHPGYCCTTSGAP